MARHGIITLLTDFGTRDHYVGAVKGVILSLLPEAKIVDISHEVGAFGVREAAYTLWGYASTFPFRTIHIAIVDPEVGTARRPILMTTENYYYLAPDNGILSFVAANETIERVIHIQEDHFFRTPVSPTFHARDIFAPAAAWLAKGTEPSNFGEEVGDFQRFEIPKPKVLGDKLLKGQVLHVDRFGNVVTNIPRQTFEEMAAKLPQSKPKLIVAAKEITAFVKTYAEAGQNLAFLFGSAGYLEIASHQRSAASVLGLSEGKEVGLMFG
jgi:hypothetical protein